LIIRSPAFSMPAQGQDVWYRPVVDTGVTGAAMGTRD
jgi:hypothetical protein